ncbi:MAG: hypothetical protein ACAI34_03195 [Verrucomicrobium sp.]|nr:hypothetical protein [Verrucomicrobium sp.]
MAYDLLSYYNSTIDAFYKNAVGSGDADAEIEAITRFRADLVSKSAIFISLGLADPVEMLEQIDARIAAFEMTIVPEAIASPDPNKPYDRTSLRREFLEEVYSVYLYAERAVKNTETDTTKPAIWAVNNDYANATLYADQPLDDFDGTTLAIAQGDWGGINNPYNGYYDVQKIFTFYNSLIEATFSAGDSFKTQIDPGTNATANVWVVTAIAPFIIGEKLYDHITSIRTGTDPVTKEPTYKTYLVESGVNLSTVSKIPVPATGTPVTFQLSFQQGVVFGGADGTDNATLVEVTMDDDGVITPLSPAVTLAIANIRALSPMEYIYYWNEARIQILKAQLAFKQAIVKEAQEDLRQANIALAQLENVANIRSQDDKGNIVSDNSKETIIMNLFNAQASTAGSSIFDRTTNNTAQGDVANSHKWGSWQTNRANLKNYIDRKSAQSQDLMLDYQQVLNRYNSSLEVLSKLQEKLDALMKSQLRNL